MSSGVVKKLSKYTTVNGLSGIEEHNDMTTFGSNPK